MPLSHRGDTHIVEFLRRAVVGDPWVTEPLSRISTHSLTFQQLYGELKSALHLYREANLAKRHDTMVKRTSSPKNEDIPGILYKRQGRYFRKHAGIGNRTKRETGPETKAANFDPLSTVGCFNSGDPGNTIGDCAKPHQRC